MVSIKNKSPVMAKEDFDDNNCNQDYVVLQPFKTGILD